MGRHKYIGLIQYSPQNKEISLTVGSQSKETYWLYLQEEGKWKEKVREVSKYIAPVSCL